MIFLSLNCRVLENPSKIICLERLIDEHNPNVFLLQKIMSVGGKIVSDLEKYLGGGILCS
jgi:hypothetical protein